MKKKSYGKAPAQRKYLGTVTSTHQGNVLVKYKQKDGEYLLHKGSEFTIFNRF
jgi:hypothetical protein